MTLAQHIVIKLHDGRMIARERAQRGFVINRIFKLARDRRLLALHLVDSHWHFLLADERRSAMRLVRVIETSLSRLLSLPVPFAPAYAEPVRTQRHLYRAFHYVLRQQSHHGIDWDPFLEASNLGDLLGARVSGAFTAVHVRRFLPRIKRADLLHDAGLTSLEPADLGVAALDALADATLAAAGIPLPRGGQARLTAIAAASAVVGRRLTAAQLARRFDVSQRTIERARRLENVPQQLVRAIRLQLALRERRETVAGEVEA